MKSKIVCIILGICIGICIVAMSICLLRKEALDTIKIKQEINLSDEERNVVNEDELIKDIKSYMRIGRFVYAKTPHYTSEDAERRTIPAYDGTDYGNGYSANSFNGKIRINGRQDVYMAERGSLLRYITIIGIIVILSIIEIILLIVILIKRKKNMGKNT